MDGFGIRAETEGNAIKAAGEPISIKPDMDALLEAFERMNNE